ncbi:MAG: hypothetical protein IOC86_05935 [Aestuariivirga sp.]|nr:hypothetical protein [Aestuariivirga sp.]
MSASAARNALLQNATTRIIMLSRPAGSGPARCPAISSFQATLHFIEKLALIEVNEEEINQGV